MPKGVEIEDSVEEVTFVAAGGGNSEFRGDMRNNRLVLVQ